MNRKRALATDQRFSAQSPPTNRLKKLNLKPLLTPEHPAREMSRSMYKKHLSSPAPAVCRLQQSVVQQIETLTAPTEDSVTTRLVCLVSPSLEAPKSHHDLSILLVIKNLSVEYSLTTADRGAVIMLTY